MARSQTPRCPCVALLVGLRGHSAPDLPTPPELTSPCTSPGNSKNPHPSPSPTWLSVFGPWSCDLVGEGECDWPGLSRLLHEPPHRGRLPGAWFGARRATRVRTRCARCTRCSTLLRDPVADADARGATAAPGLRRARAHTVSVPSPPLPCPCPCLSSPERRGPRPAARPGVYFVVDRYEL